MSPGAAQARPGKAPGPTTGENPSGFLAPRAGRPAFSLTPGTRSDRLHLRLEKGRPRVNVRSRGGWDGAPGKPPGLKRDARPRRFRGANLLGE